MPRINCFAYRYIDKKVWLKKYWKESKMLVLSRCKDESIMIGEDIEIILIDIRRDKVRLGITAPKSVPVHRREVYEAIKRKKVHQKKDSL